MTDPLYPEPLTNGIHNVYATDLKLILNQLTV